MTDMSPDAQARWDEWARSIVRSETKKLASVSTVNALAEATGHEIGKHVAKLMERLADLESEVALLRSLRSVKREDA